jgi:hypothetical protein
MAEAVLKHAFVSPFLDGPDTTKLQPSHWNAPILASAGTAGEVLTRDPASATGASWTPLTSAAHHASHEPGGTDALTALSASILTTGTLPDARLSTNVQMKPLLAADLPAHASRHVPGGVDALPVDQAAATGSLRTLGTSATSAAAGNDPRLSDARTPTAHRISHETGGGDAITALAASVITSGTIASARLPPRIGAVGIVIDGAGAVITTGVKGFLRVPFAGTITGVTVLSTDAAASAGSIVIDIWKDTFANYPPTVADTITASAKPTLTTANKSEDVTLTGWNKTIAAGDVLGFNVTSVATVTRVALTLTVQAT